LAAADRTIEVLMDRVEGTLMAAEPGDVAIGQAIAGLETEVRATRAGLDAREARQVFDGYPEGLLLIDDAGEIQAANRHAGRALETPVDQLVGVSLSTWFPRPGWDQLAAVLAARLPEPVATVLNDAVGRSHALTISWASDGTAVVVLRAPSADTILTDELVRTRRMAGVGRLASDLVRALANPLALVQARLEMLESSNLEASAACLVGEVQSDTDQISAIARDLLAFVKIRELTHRETRLDDLVAGTLDELGQRTSRVQVSPQILEPVAKLSLDEDMVRQMLVHLVLHAAEGARRGKPIELIAGVDPAGTVVLRVRREGRGLSTAERDRRSPLAYEGSGGSDWSLGFSLGLAWMLVQQHGGMLTAQDGAVGGAEYRITLPQRSARESAEAQPASARVLLVDDDSLLLQSLSGLLSADGYRVQEAGSAEEALELLAVSEVDVVFSDISLPGMDGETLVERIGERWPNLSARVILASGLLHRPRLSNPYLQKPFEMGQLRAAIAHILAPEG